MGGRPCSAWPYTSKNSRSRGQSDGSETWRHHARVASSNDQRRIGDDVADRGKLPAFDLVDDGHPQSVLRAEVMAEHPVAGAQFRRQPPQREIREAVHRDVVDSRRRAAAVGLLRAP